MAWCAYKRFSKGQSGQRGQSMLELLPVIGIMLMLTFGVIDLGRAIWQLQVISGLTREGSNLASRDTTLPVSVSAVISDGAVLNLASNGDVIITSVQNQNGAFVITGQSSSGGIAARSKVGNGVGATATLPVTAETIPQLNGTVYVTEVFSSFSPITPLGAFVNVTLPSTLYDIAYF